MDTRDPHEGFKTPADPNDRSRMTKEGRYAKFKKARKNLALGKSHLSRH